MRLPLALAALVALLPTLPALAAEPQVYRLSPEEVQQTLEAASRRPDADNPSLLPSPQRDSRPHGEVGMMIGSGGARGVYGVMGVPLGDSSSATIGFESTRMPGYYGYGQRSGRGFAPGIGQYDSFSLGVSLGNNRPAW